MATCGELVFDSHEPLEDEHMRAILFAVSGGRNISLLLALGNQQDPSTPSDVDTMYREAADVYGGEILITPKTAQHQLVHSDKAIVRVAHQGAGHRWDPHTYELTSLGAQAYALGGHIASIARTAAVSPMDLVGYRSRAKSEEGLDQPEARIKIYRALLEEDQKEIGHAIEISAVTSTADVSSSIFNNHKPALERAGIINCRSDGRRTGLPVFQKTDGPRTSDDTFEASLAAQKWNNNKRGLARWLKHAIQNWETSEIAVDDVIQRLAAEGILTDFIASKQLKQQKVHVEATLTFLANHGIVTKSLPRQLEKTTHLQLTDLGRALIHTYLDAVEGVRIRNPETLSEGRRLARAFGRSYEDLGWLLSVDFETGAIAPRAERATDLALIAKLLGDAAVETTAICEAVGWKSANCLDRLRELEASGHIRSIRCGKVLKWELTAQAQQSVISL